MSSASVTIQRRKGMTRREWRDTIDGYLGLMPWIIGFLAFTLGPMIFSIYVSFSRYEVLTPPEYIGIDNYVEMVNDKLFWQSLKVTAIYVLGAVPINVIVGYSLALLLNKKAFGLSFWRTAYYMPAVVPGLATAYLFAWMFNSELGLINGVLYSIGIQGPLWFGSREWVIPAFMLMHIWVAGGGLVLYLAALQGVPTTLYDAAVVDGAGAWQRFWNVTLPLTSPVVFFVFLTGIDWFIPGFHRRIRNHWWWAGQRVAILCAQFVSTGLEVFPHGIRSGPGVGALLDRVLFNSPDPLRVEAARLL